MTRPLVDNAGDPGQVQHATERSRLRRDQLADDFRALLATPEGRRVMFWLIGQCNVYASPFRLEANATAMEVGKQEVGRQVILELNRIDPELYPTMILTHAKDMKAAEAVRVAEKQNRRKPADTIYEEPDAEG